MTRKLADDTLRTLARVKALALQEMIAAGGKPCWVRTGDQVPPLATSLDLGRRPPPPPAAAAAAARSARRRAQGLHSRKKTGLAAAEKRQVSNVKTTARIALDAKLRLPIWQTSLGSAVSAREAALLAQMPPSLREAVERVIAKLDAPRETPKV